MQRTISLLRTVGVLLLLVLSFHSMAFGQADRATLTGHITDSSGAVMQGVTVTATSTATGTTFNNVTNSAGIYSITSLPIGDYTVVVTQAGFQNAQSSVSITGTAASGTPTTVAVNPIAAYPGATLVSTFDATWTGVPCIPIAPQPSPAGSAR